MSRIIHISMILGFIVLITFSVNLNASDPSILVTSSSVEFKIGVLAYKGKLDAINKWSAHETLLNKKLAPIKFKIIPLSYKNNELTQAVANQEVNFVITNPGHYTELELNGYVSLLATRRLSSTSGILDNFGGTAIALSSRKDINRYSDLGGKEILIPSKSSLGGWQVHLREALSQGIDLRTQAEIIELKNHRKVILSILKGNADVGFIRSDLIEELANQGELKFNQIKIINQINESDYPYLLSTRLYPEWPFAMVNGTSPDVAHKVLKVLLNLNNADPAAKAAGIYGWGIPGKYSRVRELFMEASLGPYKPKPVTLFSVVNTYRYQFLLSLIIFILLFFGFIKSNKMNSLLQQEIKKQKIAE
ncbi:MAG: PhnD/SsuA/transferrin family substrate-binding protein [Gammaproteobacteria bacterium]|nr:PhnD/SsuA/transferrin family substrate-binding protein [Gammaproteobacteria bacterium]MBT3723236.1 PhnD/SsuA/transferrin family substrate-binding protein [Gammaproteobacteria bacterium]MBT4077473.1 PhnD/SsuA/transferrin family substrate-binding protein [Gammaproteobacteria bacterium]MBT4196484.1 PhnD/SsuA/transferrin family substrate-binding protein [Gammaproteobacteria bacterium]MBT4450170.1 PhnD/SsuA/transferrin family substrate-binding protein [Gammaproteobacteria bacterium]